MDDERQYVTKEEHEALLKLHADIIDVLDRVREVLINLVSQHPSPDLVAAIEEAFDGPSES